MTASADRHLGSLRALPFGAFVTSPDGLVLAANDALLRMLGRTAAEVTSGALRLDAITAPEWHSLDRAAVAEVESRGSSGPSEKEFLAADGTRVPALVGAARADGPGAGTCWCVVDLSAQKRVEHRLRAVVECAPNAVVTIDVDGRIVLVNAETERLFGHPRAGLIGAPVEMLVPHRLRDRHPAFRAGFFADPRTRAMGAGRDLFGLRADGSEFPVEIGLNPIRTDEGAFVLAAIVDITERKRAEERFRAVVESAPSAMVMIDAAGRIVLVNALTEKLFGYVRAELLGGSIEMLVPERFRAGHPGHRAEFFAAPQSRAMGAGRDLFGLRKDGSEIPVEIGLNPIRTGEGSFVLAAVVDITERKRAERALAQKSEEVEAFVYIVSHDLRTPLVNLQGFGKELELSCAELEGLLGRAALAADVGPRVRAILDDEIPGALRYISASTNKFERLITALLGLSRSGRQAYRIERLDVASIVTATLDALRKSIQHRAAEVAVGPLPMAWGDATAIGQVFANLVGNALNYLDPARPGRIEIGGSPGALMHHFWVRDNGVGVPATARERLFQVFQRFHPELAPGEGMGLAIIKRIVERHGGRVWIETAEGQGTTVHFTLPARQERED